MLTSRGLGRVLGDLSALGYDARWGVVGAVDAGAPHKRDRIWIVADAEGQRLPADLLETGAPTPPGREEDKCRRHFQPERHCGSLGSRAYPPTPGDPEWSRTAQKAWPTPCADRALYGDSERHSTRVDRIKAIGNGQVPAVAALAWRLLTD